MGQGAHMGYLIDNLQYANWSEKVFRQMREGGVDAVHVTITYHETFREMVLQLEAWNRRFEQFPDLIMRATTGDDVATARATDRTAIFFGFQNPRRACHRYEPFGRSIYIASHRCVVAAHRDHPRESQLVASCTP